MNHQRGDIVLVNFDPARPTEAAATRPAIIVTNNIANVISPQLVVVPLTSNLERIYPHEYMLRHQDTGLDQDSKVQPQLIRHVARERIGQTIGFVSSELMQEVDDRLRSHLGL
jgi:mRNA interferase MazF